MFHVIFGYQTNKFYFLFAVFVLKWRKEKLSCHFMLKPVQLKRKYYFSFNWACLLQFCNAHFSWNNKSLFSRVQSLPSKVESSAKTVKDGEDDPFSFRGKKNWRAKIMIKRSSQIDWFIFYILQCCFKSVPGSFFHLGYSYLAFYFDYLL